MGAGPSGITVKICKRKTTIFISNTYVLLVCSLDKGHTGTIHWDETFLLEFIIPD